MIGRLFLIYAVVELMVLIGLAATIGLGWTALALVVTFLIGIVIGAPMGGWQLGRQLVRLRSGLREPGSALSDGALVALATGLVLVPGLVSTALGALLLVPPLRAVARPRLTSVAMRGLLRGVPVTADARAADPNFVDGEVIDVIDDVIDIEPLTLPQRAVVVDQPPWRASQPG
ncbi:FxsA family protein [Mycobacterium spongiae]|uniref:Membrane protein FxsA n=1 Tax=Mycobacterium spongiae TaxID=886343 RepID=A0A975JYT2_9MYCO|nr:FxsA family protein [Mycobacterium spongiae]QUR67893.1 membrane protein FxsA [Mycobacterium spongiae]